MKWNDIQKNNQPDTPITPVVDPMSASGVVSLSKKRTMRWIAIVLVAVLLIVGIVLLIRAVVNNTQKSVLPPQQLQDIGTFLDENPPTPVTNEQADMITNTLDQPVELDTNDVQALNNFFKQ